MPHEPKMDMLRKHTAHLWCCDHSSTLFTGPLPLLRLICLQGSLEREADAEAWGNVPYMRIFTIEAFSEFKTEGLESLSEDVE